MLGAQRFRFLGQEGELRESDDWNDPGRPKLWLYNLHYFDDLNAQDSEARRGWHEALICRWIADNPPPHGTGWEPYPTSVRIVNWIKWSLRGNRLEQDALDSLAVQVRWLRRRLEFHLLGNHLFSNAKALIFAGLFLDGEEPARWLRLGRSILERELSEQLLADGGHFERSPMYHNLMTEDLLDLVQLHECYGLEPPGHWRRACKRMLDWAVVMTHPDGDIPFFNDASVGVAARTADLQAYGAVLGVGEPEPVREGLTDLAASGYVRMQTDSAVAFLDIAAVGPDYLPGHAHADTLAFELSLAGHRVFVNCGTSEYGTGARRQWERGTAAHNTVVIDDEETSEVWAGFRVARRARITTREVEARGGMHWAQGAHDGYRRLRGRVTHVREWELRSGSILVRDRIVGRGSHSVVAWFHLHPDCTVVSIGEEAVEIRRGQAGRVCRVRFAGRGRLSVESNEYAPEFGRRLPISSLRYAIDDAPLPLTITTEIAWASDQAQGPA